MMTGNYARNWTGRRAGGEPKPIEELEIPSFLQRIKQVNVKKRISLYASDSDFYKTFSKDVDIAHDANTDQEANDMLIGEIGSDEYVPPMLSLRNSAVYKLQGGVWIY